MGYGAVIGENMVKVRIWDLPTRVFHWALVLCVLGLVVSGQIGGSVMAWHFRLGYVVLALLLFRLVWGFVGGRWSRFGVFVRAPGVVLAYLRGKATPDMEAGHNPLGALSVLGLLAVGLVQVTTGLFSDDEIFNSGPLAHWVSSDWVSLATRVHSKFNKVLLLALVLLHIGAIVYYRVAKRRDLVRPMLTGDKELAGAAEPSHDTWGSRLFALCLFMAIQSGVWWGIQSLGST
jgi:cytochrome b